MTPLARDLAAARKRYRIPTAVLASQIGISESALRRIETGVSRTVRSDTRDLIRAWAARRGYSHFAGENLTPRLPGIVKQADVSREVALWFAEFEADQEPAQD